MTIQEIKEACSDPDTINSVDHSERASSALKLAIEALEMATHGHEATAICGCDQCKAGKAIAAIERIFEP